MSFDLNTLEGNLNLISMGPAARRFADQATPFYGPVLRSFWCETCHMGVGGVMDRNIIQVQCPCCNGILIYGQINKEEEP